MSNLKQALTRKLGPLPAWGWALILFGAVWYYRNKIAGTGTVSGTGTGSVGPAPDQNPPQVLEPGQSVYDPNTGGLTTAPGGSTDTSTGAASSDPSDAINGLTSAISDALNMASTSATGNPVPPTGATAIAARAGAHPATGSKAGPHGAIWAAFGPKRPPNKKGYRTVGVGNGKWMYVPKGGTHAAKPKPGNQPSKTGQGTKHTTPEVHSPKPAPKRSTAAIHSAKGRAKTIGAKITFSRPTPPPKPTAPPKREGPTHPVIGKPTVRARPAPAHATPPPPHANPPRPSSPPKRDVRAPAPKPAPKPARKRK